MVLVVSLCRVGRYQTTSHMPVPMLITLKLQSEVGEVSGALSPISLAHFRNSTAITQVER